MVASKIPLPNYRPDLDDKRPQREVVSCSLLENSLKAEIICSICWEWFYGENLIL